MPPKVLAIVGPTASGKTRLGVEAARALNGEVVSVDSMQVYRRMDIGTAKPTPEEMGGVPHHMLDVAEPWEDFSAARYVELAAPCVDDILARGKLPILVGGTGLYLDSLLSGRTFAPRSTGWRERLQARARAEGTGPLLAELRAVDPEGLEPCCELFPGIVYTQMTYRGRRYDLISKSGGFGAPDLIEKLRDRIDRPGPRRAPER